MITDPVFQNHIYVGNDLGVYLSTNAGASWSAFQSGISDAAIVMELSISESNKKIRAVTHGKGIFERYLYSTTVGVNNISSTPDNFRLNQNYPNPFNPSTKIEYSLGSRSNVKLSVYNSLGKLVKTLFEGQQGAGSYSVTWTGTDNNGAALSSGIYFYKITADNFIQSKKMLLLK